VVAAVLDGATKNLTLQNQSVGTAATGFSLTYQLVQPNSNVYVTGGQNLTMIAKVGEVTAGSALTKYGAGTLVLGTSGTSNTHAFTGGLTANGGFVNIYSQINLGSGTVTLNGATLQITQAGTPLSSVATRTFSMGADGGTILLGSTTNAWTLLGPIAGAGRLTAAGSSTGSSQVLTLSGSGSNYAGGLTITAGATVSTALFANLGSAPSAPVADFLRLDNGTLSWTESGTVTTGSSNRGTTIGAGGGTVNVTSSSETLGFAGAFASDGASVGTLTKTGAGTLRFTGANTYAGPTSVLAGLLRDNGTHVGAGSYLVASGASYGGSGILTLAAGSAVNVGGTLTPGATLGGTTAFGTLTINGDVAMSNAGSAGTLLVDVNPASTTPTDKLVVNGALNLAGSSVSLALTNDASFATPLVFATYNTLAGTFANTQALADAGFAIDYAYQGNNIALTAVPEPAALGLLGLGGIGLLRRRRITR
ncbi:MAG: hypothetical protein JWO31_403, partial [Phycisphaerales bacterium]|nr:hypothetical protein [Phycisphaerales bacterium]